jgi:three-Cys-motif partner protein
MSSVPKTTVWPLEEHTKGKHLVLRKYLDAWLPILGSTQGRVIFIDGFAGPGAYTGGEDGSPIIALKAFANHPARARMKEVRFWFIEKDPARAAHLDKLVEPYKEMLGQGSIDVTCGSFDAEVSGVLTELAENTQKMAPAFVMIDPFGVSQTPMAVVRQILQNPKCEVSISFMAEFIGRFKAEEGWEVHLDGLFGTDEWRQYLQTPNHRLQRQQFFELYKRQLKNDGAKHVVHFELYRSAELVYAIFFATQSHVGCNKMKEAIWKADPAGGMSFISGRDAAMDLFTNDISRFEPEIEARLRLHPPDEWVSIESIEKWAMGDETHFHCGQLKAALRNLETNGLVEADETTRRRRKTYPAGTMLQLRR